jgi:hypothetical protein
LAAKVQDPLGAAAASGRQGGDEEDGGVGYRWDLKAEVQNVDAQRRPNRRDKSNNEATKQIDVSSTLRRALRTKRGSSKSTEQREDDETVRPQIDDLHLILPRSHDPDDIYANTL